jgi:hypothetical protein
MQYGTIITIPLLAAIALFANEVLRRSLRYEHPRASIAHETLQAHPGRIDLAERDRQGRVHPPAGGQPSG